VQPKKLPKGYEKAVEKARMIKEAREKRNQWNEHGGYTEETYKKSQKMNRNGAFSFGEGKDKKMHKKRDPSFFMDVKLAGGKKGRIGICQGDNPRILAKSFAKTYTLGPAMEEKLVNLIGSTMKANFPEEGGDGEEGQ